MVHSRAVLFPLTSDCYLSFPAWYGIVWYGSLSRLGIGKLNMMVRYGSLYNRILHLSWKTKKESTVSRFTLPVKHFLLDRIENDFFRFPSLFYSSLLPPPSHEQLTSFEQYSNKKKSTMLAGQSSLLGLLFEVFIRATGVLSIGTDPNRRSHRVVESLNEPSCDEVGSEVT